MSHTMDKSKNKTEKTIYTLHKNDMLDSHKTLVSIIRYMARTILSCMVIYSPLLHAPTLLFLPFDAFALFWHNRFSFGTVLNVYITPSHVVVSAVASGLEKCWKALHKLWVYS